MDWEYYMLWLSPYALLHDWVEELNMNKYRESREHNSYKMNIVIVNFKFMGILFEIILLLGRSSVWPFLKQVVQEIKASGIC